MNSVVLSLSVRRDNIGDPTYIFHVSAHGLIRRDRGKFALLTRVRIINRKCEIESEQVISHQRRQQ